MDAISDRAKLFVDAAITGAAPAQNEIRERPTPISGAALLRMDIPMRRTLLSPCLSEAGSAMLYAPRGVGKTWVALTMAYAVACGGEALGWKAERPAKTLYVDGEMPLVTLQERLAALALGMGKEPPAEEYLQFLPADHYRDGLPDLGSPEGQRLIEDLTDGVSLVVFDNLSSLARGKENEADSWQPIQDLVLRLRRRGTTSLLVHHAGKSGAQRGTSRREDVLDTVIALRRPENYDAQEGSRFEVHYEKARGFHGDAARPFEAALNISHNNVATWETNDLSLSGKAAAMEMFAAGKSVKEVVKDLSVPKATAYRWNTEFKGGGNAH